MAQKKKTGKDEQSKPKKEVWPKGHQKILNRYAEVVRQDSFVEKVAAVRKEFKIPKKGFRIPKNFKGVTDVPKSFSKAKLEKIEQVALQLAFEYDLQPLRIYPEVIMALVLFDVFLIPDYVDFAKVTGKPPIKVIREEYIKETFPIEIRISPYASQRELVDFIKYNYKRYIKPQQIFYRGAKETRMGVARGKQNFLVQDFLYENQDKTMKYLISETREQFGVIKDEGTIRKEIAEENKRRKDGR